MPATYRSIKDDRGYSSLH